MKPEDRARLEALNTDHHHRMSHMHDLHTKEQIAWFDERNARSRDAITNAMLGCEARLQMRQPGQRALLELGAAYAGEREWLISRFDGCVYVGIDVVNTNTEHVHHMAIEEMPPWWDGQFQYIHSRHVMEHVVDLDGALSRIKRVLAPNGIVGAVTPHVFPDREPAHVTQQTLGEWMAHYRRHGLQPVYAKLEDFACAEAHIVCVHAELAQQHGLV